MLPPMRWIAPLLVLLALLLAPTAQAGFHERELRSLVNAERAGHGVAKLRHSPALSRSATRYARRLLRRGVLAHGARISAPRRFSLLAENLALVGGSGPQPGLAVRLWMHSPGHRAAVLHTGMRRMGAGRATGYFRGQRATVWVLHLGRR
jgi:uncharacterized protein YkwD